MKQPKAPSATSLASAQTTANKDSIAQQIAANRVDQTDAFGNTLKYTQTGTDAQGNPTYAANQQLGQQGQQYAGGLANMAQQYFNTAGQGAPNSMDGFNQAMSFYDESQAPYLARQDAAMESKLRNQGLDPTSAAYRSSTGDLRNSQGQARNNFVQNAQGQFFNQGMQGRQQQMSELSPGINAASTFLNPSYANVPGVQTPGAVDMAGLMQNEYQNKQNAYSGMLGGLAKIGGSLAMAPVTGGGSLIGSFFGK